MWTKHFSLLKNMWSKNGPPVLKGITSMIFRANTKFCILFCATFSSIENSMTVKSLSVQAQEITADRVFFEAAFEKFCGEESSFGLLKIWCLNSTQKAESTSTCLINFHFFLKIFLWYLLGMEEKMNFRKTTLKLNLTTVFISKCPTASLELFFQQWNDVLMNLFSPIPDGYERFNCDEKNESQWRSIKHILVGSVLHADFR